MKKFKFYLVLTCLIVMSCGSDDDACPPEMLTGTYVWGVSSKSKRLQL